MFEDKVWTFRELDALVQTMAAAFERTGMRPGCHVAALLPNIPEAVLAIHALARVGAVSVPLNMRLIPMEMTMLVEQTEAEFLLYSDESRAQVLETRAGDCGATTINLSELSWDARLEGAQVDPAPWDAHSHSSVQAIVFTSGTTGTPKGAMLTFGNHFASALASAYHLGVLPEDRWMLCMPLYHVGGLAIIWRACLYGIAIVMLERFDETAVLDAIERHRVTMISLVPTMLARLLELPAAGRVLKQVRVILLGGAAGSPKLLERCAEVGLPLAPTYGLTEAASQVATALPGEWYMRAGSAGRPLPFTRLRIINDSGAELPPGEVGEIVLSGPTVMKGYYGLPEETAAAIQDGWLRTGDLGHLDNDGHLWIVQRRTDLIVSGGENIYPAEVESVLLQHPAVSEACVVGLPDEEWGQRVVAVIVPVDGAAVEAEDLLALCRARLGGYKLPRTIRSVAELPRTPSGKIVRREVARMMQSETMGAAESSKTEGKRNGKSG